MSPCDLFARADVAPGHKLEKATVGLWQANRREERFASEKVVAWYLKGPLAVEHSFTIEASPPVVDASTAGALLLLVVELQLNGLQATMGREKDTLTNRNGNVVLCYGGMAAWHQTGYPLRVQGSLSGHRCQTQRPRHRRQWCSVGRRYGH